MGFCSISGCDRKPAAKGYCGMHYQRVRRYGNPDAVLYQPRPAECSVDDCSQSVLARALCSKHYDRMRSSGTTERLADTATPKGTKRCSRCSLVKDLSQFGIRSGRGSLAPRSACKACEVDASRQYRNKYPDRVRTSARNSSLRQLYGVTAVDDYERLMDEQGGVCAICGRPERLDRYGHLSIDHDHQTGVIRGLLCSAHNRAIGLLGDDPVLVRKAAEYLERYA